MMVSALRQIEVSMKISPNIIKYDINGKTISSEPLPSKLEGIVVLANASGLSFSNFLISEMIARGYDLGNTDSLSLTIEELLSTEK